MAVFIIRWNTQKGEGILSPYLSKGGLGEEDILLYKKRGGGGQYN